MTTVDDTGLLQRLAELEARLEAAELDAARADDRGAVENVFNRYMHYHNAYEDERIIEELWVSPAPRASAPATTTSASTPPTSRSPPTTAAVLAPSASCSSTTPPPLSSRSRRTGPPPRASGSWLDSSPG